VVRTHKTGTSKDKTTETGIQSTNKIEKSALLMTAITYLKTIASSQAKLASLTLQMKSTSTSHFFFISPVQTTVQ